MKSAGKKCPKCEGEMSEGFILDITRNRYAVSRWVAGKPEKSFWHGTNIDGKDQYPIQTFRCIKCHYLESYASES